MRMMMLVSSVMLAPGEGSVDRTVFRSVGSVTSTLTNVQVN